MPREIKPGVSKSVNLPLGHRLDRTRSQFLFVPRNLGLASTAPLLVATTALNAANCPHFPPSTSPSPTFHVCVFMTDHFVITSQPHHPNYTTHLHSRDNNSISSPPSPHSCSITYTKPSSCRIHQDSK